MHLAVSFASVVLSIALATGASPVLGAISPSSRSLDNGYCQQLLKICASSPNALSNPWSVKACLFGAACYGPADNFLAAVASFKQVSSHVSRDEPRVSQSVFNSISTNSKVITQQNFIDGVYGTLATTNGPFPGDAVVVEAAFSRLSEWTSFCNGQGIPFKNFADYFQFSSTVSSPGCGTATPTPVKFTTITLRPVTTLTPSRLPTSTRGVPSASASATPVGTPPGGLDEASCNKMFSTCVVQVNQSVSDPWSHLACLFAATCGPNSFGDHPVDGFLETLLLAKTNSLGDISSISSKTETRLSTATMKSISTDGRTITQQNWIDGYYSLLSSVGGPFPTSASIVIDDFDTVRAWTGFCTGGIPFKNVADYFQFSASVASNTAC